MTIPVYFLFLFFKTSTSVRSTLTIVPGTPTVRTLLGVTSARVKMGMTTWISPGTTAKLAAYVEVCRHAYVNSVGEVWGSLNMASCKALYVV